MSNDLFELDGQVAIVTGAGRGIGAGIAKVLAEAGAHVICAARRTSEIEQVAREITEANGSAIAVTTDVTDVQAVNDLAQTAIDTFGKLDILVNNAGGSPLQAPLLELPVEGWDATLALNLIGSASVTLRRRVATNTAVGNGIGIHRHRYDQGRDVDAFTSL